MILCFIHQALIRNFPKVIASLVIMYLSLSMTHSNAKANTSLLLGDPDSKIMWVYLTGLNQSFYAAGEKNHRDILSRIGRQLHLKIIAVPPNGWCPEFDQKHCWLQETKKDREITYQYIISQINNQSIAGIVGFSNGGFFLNQLAQERNLEYPLISIGSAGERNEKPIKNELYLLIGQYDHYHYKPAVNFYQELKDTDVKIHWIEYEGGHEIPEQTLYSLLKRLQKK